MILDKFYCSKRQETFEIHYSNNRFMVIGDDTFIDFMPDIHLFLKTIEHKPQSLLFKDSGVIGNYLTGLRKIWKLDEK